MIQLTTRYLNKKHNNNSIQVKNVVVANNQVSDFNCVMVEHTYTNDGNNTSYITEAINITDLVIFESNEGKE